MATDRASREFQTEGGHTVAIYEYVTGNEARTIKAVSDAGQGSPEATEKAQDRAIEIAVLSLDGSRDGLLERIGELPLADYAEIVAAVTALLNPKKKIAGIVAEYVSGRIRDDMIVAVICEKMGWTYLQYQEQPLWFTELLIEKLAVDGKKQQAASKAGPSKRVK